MAGPLRVLPGRTVSWASSPAPTPTRVRQLDAPAARALLRLRRGGDAPSDHPNVFPGESLNDIDPILNGIDDLAARASLIAVEEKSDTGRRYRFDIVLQGEAETQFFIER
nr:hypothetical protein [Delftia lacustris]